MHRGVRMVLERCENGVRMVLQWCYKGGGGGDANQFCTVYQQWDNSVTKV
jgi:hypothetical protein